jgi:hypothetical protein
MVGGLVPFWAIEIVKNENSYYSSLVLVPRQIENEYVFSFTYGLKTDRGNPLLTGLEIGQSGQNERGKSLILFSFFLKVRFYFHFEIRVRG